MSFPFEVLHGPYTRYVKFQMIYPDKLTPQKLLVKSAQIRTILLLPMIKIGQKPSFEDLMMFILREKVVLNANYIIKSAINTILSKPAPSNLPIFYILRYTTHFAKSYGWILNMFREFVHFSLFWSLNPI